MGEKAMKKDTKTAVELLVDIHRNLADSTRGATKKPSESYNGEELHNLTDRYVLKAGCDENVIRQAKEIWLPYVKSIEENYTNK